MYVFRFTVQMQRLFYMFIHCSAMANHRKVLMIQGPQFPGRLTPPSEPFKTVSTENAALPPDLQQKIDEVQQVLKHELKAEEKLLGKIYQTTTQAMQNEPEKASELAEKGNQQIKDHVDHFFESLPPASDKQLHEVCGKQTKAVVDHFKNHMTAKYSVNPDEYVPVSDEQKANGLAAIEQGIQNTYGPDANLGNVGSLSSDLLALIEEFKKAPRAMEAGAIFTRIEMALGGVQPSSGTSGIDLSQVNPSDIDAVMKAAAKKGFSGSVLVVQNGETVFAKGYGYARGDIKNTAHTTFHWGSITKVVTATAILQLKENAGLNLDVPVADYLPEYKNSIGLGGNPPVTIRELLNMTSGIAEPPASNWLDHPPSLKDMLDYVASHPRSGQGTIAYSNTGYNVLAAVIERVSGVSYGRYVKDNIFDPADMWTASAPSRLSRDHTQAEPHIWDDSGHRVPITPDHYPDYTSMRIGAGNINGSVYDLEKFDTALDNGTLISSDDLKLMQTPDPVTGARFAWDPGIHTVNGQQFLTKSGAIEGEQNLYMRLPNSNTSIFIMGNVDPKPPITPDDYLMPLAIDIGKLLFPKE